MCSFFFFFFCRSLAIFPEFCPLSLDCCKILSEMRQQFGSSHENIRIVLLNFMNLIVQTNADRQTEYEMVFVAMVSTLHYDFSVVSFQSLPVQVCISFE